MKAASVETFLEDHGNSNSWIAEKYEQSIPVKGEEKLELPFIIELLLYIWNYVRMKDGEITSE